MAEGGGFFLDLPDAEPTTTQLHGKVLSQTLESSHQVGKSPRSLGRHVDHQGSQMPMQRGCSQCVSLSYSEDLYRAFGVYVCGACRKDVKLISKTCAKQQYLVTDGDLKPLGSLERKNPRKKDWNPMKLYMESQVKEVAYAKYGGQAGLEWEARVKVGKKLESRIQEKERKAFESARKSKRIKEIHEALKEGETRDQNIEGVEEEDI